MFNRIGSFGQLCATPVVEGGARDAGELMDDGDVVVVKSEETQGFLFLGGGVASGHGDFLFDRVNNVHRIAHLFHSLQVLLLCKATVSDNA